MLIIAGALLCLAGGCAPSLSRHEFTRICMGVRTRVVVYAPSQARAEEGAAAAFERIAELEEIMSDYRPGSELSRLGATSGREVKVSGALYEILSQAQRVSRATDGAFDITVGPVVRLWRESVRTQRLPGAEELARAREAVGFGHVRLDPGARSVRLERAGMRLDLGGIAKGYAAEAAVAALRRRGLGRAMVALGGDIYAGDPPPGARGWRVAVRGVEDGAILLKNLAVSSSGASEQFVEIDGVRYSHIVDPRTGLGTTGGIEATVVSRRGAWADALPTAVCVLGRGEFVREFPGTGAIIMKAGGERVVVDPWGVVEWAR